MVFNEKTGQVRKTRHTGTNINLTTLNNKGWEVGLRGYRNDL